ATCACACAITTLRPHDASGDNSDRVSPFYRCSQHRRTRSERKVVTDRTGQSVVLSLHCMNDPQREGHMASYIQRRKFLATLGCMAARGARATDGQDAADWPHRTRTAETL